jgi:hypothetical protein
MAIPTKGSRPLRHGDHDYRWTIRRNPTYCQGLEWTPMRVAVARAEGTCVLVVDLVQSRPDNWVAPHQTAVTPRMVRDMIDAALAAGWAPEAGGVFEHVFPLARDRL